MSSSQREHTLGETEGGGVLENEQGRTKGASKLGDFERTHFLRW